LYSAELAQRKYDARQKGKEKACHFTPEIQMYVEEKLSKKLSPEQIVGVAKREGVSCVSHERIYQHVWRDKKKGGKLHKHLRTGGKKYRKRGALKDKRGILPNRVPICERPQVVEQRERLGDLEIDTIIGLNHQGAIVTINDRASGMLKMKKLNGKDAGELSEKVIEILQDWQPFLKTITSDNGKEFAQHERMAQALGIDFFFAQHYHSWQRGSNENLNGLIRQYIPKKTDFNTITDEYVQFVENELNNRPRKRFDFLTPVHIFNLKVAFTT
jgi:IS30 family transposase